MIEKIVTLKTFGEDENETTFFKILKNEGGNYVIQKVFEQTNMENKNIIKEKVKNCH